MNSILWPEPFMTWEISWLGNLLMEEKMFGFPSSDRCEGDFHEWSYMPMSLGSVILNLKKNNLVLD